MSAPSGGSTVPATVNRILLALVLLVATSPTGLRAANNLTPLPGTSIQTYPLGSADSNLIVERIRQIVGNGTSQVLHDRAGNAVTVVATQDQHFRIKELLRPYVALTPRNIQIAVRIIDLGGAVDRRVSVDATSAVASNDFPRRQTRIDAAIAGQTTQSRYDSTQFINVTSGGRATIVVAQEIPYTDWFLSYSTRFGYLRGQTQWQQVGASLVVEPEILGDGSWIRVRLTPQLSYFADRQQFTTAIINASTDLNCRNGQEISLAGQTSSQEVYQRLLTGFDSARHLRSIDIMLRVSTLQ